jgi:hypothetical protein
MSDAQKAVRDDLLEALKWAMEADAESKVTGERVMAIMGRKCKEWERRQKLKASVGNGEEAE